MQNEVYVYVGKVEDFKDNFILPFYIKEKIAEMKNEKAINQKKASYALLKKAVWEVLGFEDDFKHIKQNENGKPISNKYCFSISHSNDLVCVALSKNNVGVDIEKENQRKEKLKEYILHENEKTENLNEIWTKKEAIFKYLGEKKYIPQKINTLNYNVLTKIIKNNNENYYLSIISDAKNIKLINLIN